MANNARELIESRLVCEMCLHYFRVGVNGDGGGWGEMCRCAEMTFKIFVLAFYVPIFAVIIFIFLVFFLLLLLLLSFLVCSVGNGSSSGGNDLIHWIFWRKIWRHHIFLLKKSKKTQNRRHYKNYEKSHLINDDYTCSPWRKRYKCRCLSTCLRTVSHDIPSHPLSGCRQQINLFTNGTGPFYRKRKSKRFILISNEAGKGSDSSRW